MDIIRADQDFDTSVLKALDEIDPNYHRGNGVIVLGSHAPTNVEEKLEQIKHAREEGIPFLGICLGMELMVIEYAKNVLGLVDANSTELDPNTTTPVIERLPELRVGIRPVTWNEKETMESHWHKYAFNPEYEGLFKEEFEMSFTNRIAEIMKHRTHPFFVGTQFHPEYQSSQDKPHFILKSFLDACTN